MKDNPSFEEEIVLANRNEKRRARRASCQR